MSANRLRKSDLATAAPAGIEAHYNGLAVEYAADLPGKAIVTVELKAIGYLRRTIRLRLKLHARPFQSGSAFAATIGMLSRWRTGNDRASSRIRELARRPPLSRAVPSIVRPVPD